MFVIAFLHVIFKVIGKSLCGLFEKMQCGGTGESCAVYAI